jgi:NAD(P)-dependent dehydrogenase (short-subunit alcohol dehydrogenase family)
MREGSNAIVTGGATGIGAAISRALLAQGVRVAVVPNQPQGDLDDFCAALDSGGNGALGFHCDLSSADAIGRLLPRIRRDLGIADILVNCAGTFARAPIEDMAVEAISTIVAVNLLAPMLLTRALLPAMREKRSGHIINIASVEATSSVADTAVYAATKAGLVQFTKIVAGGLGGSGIRINAIAPGPVRTAMIGFADEGVPPDENEALHDRLRMSRSPSGQALIEPSQIAGIALFLLSEAAIAVQGAVLLADDGWSSVIPY